MKLSTFLRPRLFAAGSLSALAVALVLTPFNMGGCSTGGINIGGHGFGGRGGGGPDIGQAVSGVDTMYKSQQLSEKDEDSIGQSVALEATNRYPLYRDQKLVRYVTLVARTVGAVSSSNGLKWYVGILDSDQ